MVTYQFEDGGNESNLSVLKNYLLKFYTPEARCIAFEASPFVAVPHRIEEFRLDTINKVEFSKRTTMMIYPEQEIEKYQKLPKGFSLF